MTLLNWLFFNKIVSVKLICLSSFLSLSQICVGEGKTGHKARKL